MFLQLFKTTPTYFMVFFFLAMLFIQILIFSVGHFKSCFVYQISLNESFPHICAGISSLDDSALLSVSLAHHPANVCAYCGAGPWGELRCWVSAGCCSEPPVLSVWTLCALGWLPRLWQGKWTLGNAMQVLGGRDSELGFVFVILFALNLYTNLRSVAIERTCYYVALFLSSNLALCPHSHACIWLTSFRVFHLIFEHLLLYVLSRHLVFLLQLWMGEFFLHTTNVSYQIWTCSKFFFFLPVWGIETRSFSFWVSVLSQSDLPSPLLPFILTLGGWLILLVRLAVLRS